MISLDILEYLVWLAMAYPIIKGVLAIIQKAREIKNG